MSTRTVRMLGSSAAVAMTEPTPAVSSMTRAEYDAIKDRENFSTLKLMAKSPAHYRERKLNPPGPDSDAMRIGRATHLAVLEPDLFLNEVAVWGGERRAGKEWEAFKERNAGREILRADEYATCRALADAVRNCDAAASYLADGASEQTLLWTLRNEAVGDFPAVEFNCKGRVDWLGSDCLLDLKTTRDASPEAFGRSCFGFGYHAQAAFYVDGLKAATGLELPFVVLAVETSAPFAVQPYRMSEEMLEVGREAYRAWLDRLDLCRRENRWPGYGDGELPLELPEWERRKREREEQDLSGIGLDFGDEA